MAERTQVTRALELPYDGRMRAVLVLVLAASSSCSMLFMEPLEQDWKYSREPRCTETAGFAVWDGVLALVDAGVGAWGVYAFRESDGDEDYEDARPYFAGAALIGLAGAAVHGVSTVVGLRRADRCSEAVATRERYLDWREERAHRVPRVDPVTPAPDAGTAEPNAPADAGVVRTPP